MKRAAALLGLLLACACGPDFVADGPHGAGGENTTTTGASPGAGGAGGTNASGPTSGTSTGGGAPPALRIGTWNLHNFSTYGTTEYRIGDLASEIESLDLDVLGVQELKVTDGSGGAGEQAFDVLLDQLPGHAGLHNPWNSFDTTVGLIYRSATTTVVAARALFDDDNYAFPRPPLEVALRIDKGGVDVELTVVVLHLKAFADSVDRRRAASAKLDTYLADTPDARVVLLGDLNDDPHDPPADNAFLGSLLGTSRYTFVTDVLAPESVTSLGYHHWVDGVQIDGEFLDHFIVTTALANDFSSLTPTIVSVPEAERSAFEQSHSDHFPVVLDLAP